MNPEISKQKKASPQNHSQFVEPAGKSVKGRKIIVVLIIVVVGVAASLSAWSMLSGPVVTARSTYVSQRGDMSITVTEGGSIRAKKSIEYICEVERRGGELNILNIVSPGTYVTQEDVDKGMVLVELDSSSLKEQLTQEKMELTGDQESMTSALEAHDIQLLQNESDVASDLLKLRFALMALQKYLGNDLAEEMTHDVAAITNLTDHVAPFLEKVRQDPNLLDGSASGQELKSLMDAIVLSEGNLKTAQATLAGTEQLHQADYVSDLDLDRDRLTVTNRLFSLENAIVNRDLFLLYDFPKNAEQTLSDYIEAGRKLERTYAQCRSLVAQAQAKLSSAKENLASQKRRVEWYEDLIVKCTIKARAPGLVIYGTGGSGDAYAAMRGRRGGGGGSGMIAAGESVYQGQTLISMPDTVSMVAEISVHETEVDKVQPGQAAQIIMDAFPDKILEGEVLEVAPLPDQAQGFMNPDLKVYKTLISIEGTHDFLRTRMSCKVEILVRELNDIIMVPIQVVANRRGRKVIYISNNGDVEERVVKTGAFNDSFVQIIEGLQEGEEVLLNPPLFTETNEPPSSSKSRSNKKSDVDATGAPTESPKASGEAGQSSSPKELEGDSPITDETIDRTRQGRRTPSGGRGMRDGTDSSGQRRQRSSRSGDNPPAERPNNPQPESPEEPIILEK